MYTSENVEAVVILTTILISFHLTKTKFKLGPEIDNPYMKFKRNLVIYFGKSLMKVIHKKFGKDQMINA